MSSYFEEGKLSTRFLCYFGHTGDLFVDELLYPRNLEHALHRRLKAAGYERVVFYGYGQGAYFLDEGSRELWHGRQAQEMTIDDLFGDMPGLTGSLLPLSVPAEQERRPMSFEVSAAEMLRHTETFLKDADIRTAVVFPDGVGVLKRFAVLDQGGQLDSFFQQVTAAGVSQLGNSNVAVFVFDRTEDQVEALFTGQARESLRNYLLTPGKTTRHVIGLPGKGEVRRLLNYLRLWGHGGKRLQVDCGALDAISDTLARTMAANHARRKEKIYFEPGQLQTWLLKDTLQFLVSRFLVPGEELTLESCRRVCRGSSKVPALDRLEALVGMQSVKETVRAFVAHGLAQGTAAPAEAPSRLDREPAPVQLEKINLHFTLTGNQGTGKTTAAELLGEILCEAGLLATGQTVKTTPGKLLDSHVGGSEQNLLRAVEEAMGGVLFIDEAYDLLKPEADGMVTVLLDEMISRQGRFGVVLAGYRNRIEELFEKGNPGLKSRFGNQLIHIDDYSVEELGEIFRRKAKKQGFALSAELEELLPHFLHNWYYDKRRSGWANGREMENLLQAMTVGRKNTGVLEISAIPEEYRQYTTGQAGEEAWAQLRQMIGLERVKEEIEDLILCIEDGDDPGPLHFLFEGPPGVGKTTVAKKLGKIFQNIGVLDSGHTVSVKPDQLIEQHVGGTAQKARPVFESAVDGVLFIDEAYGLVPDKWQGTNAQDFGGAVINLLLEYTDPGSNKPLCVICAGYRQDLQNLMACNEGLSSRFTPIHFESYSPEQLLQILRLKVEKSAYTTEDSYWEASLDSIRANIDELQCRYNGRGMEKYLTHSLKKARRRRRDLYGRNAPPEMKKHLTAADALTAQELAAVLNQQEA